jgi:hypothetical protein
MLEVLTATRPLVFTSRGRLLPWLGPALRGLLGWRLKAENCRYPRDEWLTTWKYCAGCPHMAECAFGQTLEPDPPPGAVRFKGQEQANRPIVLGMPFPMPVEARPGLASSVSVTLIGASAIAREAAVWQALTAAGADPKGGFDPEHTTFRVEQALAEPRREFIHLPLVPDANVGVEQVRVRLTSPLALHAPGPRGRQVVLSPSFADLLRASLRVLGGLFGLYDAPLPAEFASLKDLSGSVPAVRSEFVPFRQGHRSNRSGQRRDVVGVMGWGEFGPVPAALVDWLGWGGRVHVGTDRVAGAGGWRLEVREGGNWREWSPAARTFSREIPD